MKSPAVQAIEQEAERAAEKSAALNQFLHSEAVETMRMECREMWIAIFESRSAYDELAKALKKRAAAQEEYEAIQARKRERLKGVIKFSWEL